MRILFIIAALMLTSCAESYMSTADYCGKKLGLRYGTKEYADCGLKYDALKVVDRNNEPPIKRIMRKEL